MNSVLDELKHYRYKIDEIKAKKLKLIDEKKLVEDTLNQLNNKLNIIIESSKYYKKAIDICYERSVKELQDTINAALKYVYDDRNIEIKIVLSDKRGKSLSLECYEDELPVSLKDGQGKGVCCVVSAIIHIYYLNCKGCNILLLDEAYSNVYQDNVEPFFNFLVSLCKKLNFSIVFITHDPRFEGYATKVYEVNKGVVTVRKQDENN